MKSILYFGNSYFVCVIEDIAGQRAHKSIGVNETE